ncbi:MAG: hypothetical protein M3460_07925 [Actinomycetota bacterium]|nr:hypothetical protein [Actinomycetota bacterium]
MTQSAAPTVPRNGFGITAVVLAVIGLVPFTGFIALILGLLAVVFGCWAGHVPAMESPPTARWS